MPHKIHGFEEKPPRIAYVDPSFFLNLMVKDSVFFAYLDMLYVKKISLVS